MNAWPQYVHMWYMLNARRGVTTDHNENPIRNEPGVGGDVIFWSNPIWINTGATNGKLEN